MGSERAPDQGAPRLTSVRGYRAPPPGPLLCDASESAVAVHWVSATLNCRARTPTLMSHRLAATETGTAIWVSVTRMFTSPSCDTLPPPPPPWWLASLSAVEVQAVCPVSTCSA